uniref:VWFA domain-containing protein n=1 Tax=Parascaris univalens TaxID=6257 RepID=A0A915CEU5_PARUN
MVYSSELGYDPDEWEECPDEEHRMLFGFFTRMLLSLFAVGSTVFLLWFMEARKQWAKAAKECKEPVFVETIVKEEDEEIHVISELPQKLMKETKVVPSFTKEEEEALEEWRREVARLEEARLRELDDRICDGSNGLSEIETESQLIDSLLPADEISVDLDAAEQENFQVLKNVCATPPCTPPETGGTYGRTPPFEEITKKLIADDQRISEVPSEQHEFELVKEMGTTNGNGLADWEAPPIAAFEKIEQIAEIDDTMTYAPEIQSIEIPPDQGSENSEILQEYFDQVAAECTNVFKMPLMQARTASATGSGVPARRLEYSPSISSIRSGKSYTSSEGLRKQSSLLSALGVTSMQEMLLTLTSLEALSAAMAKAGLESTNLIFGIDYTASNKYQGEQCFGGRSLHSLDPLVPNPYQQVISVMGRTLAPFATSGFIPAYGFGDSKTGDWSVFKLKEHGECRDLDDVLSVYNEVTPTISLSGPTNFAPLIYQAIEICERVQDYHILVIVADGQVTNEKATRKAIVRACQYPLSIIVVGVGDGPWEMMRIFDESLPKRPWDNFHFVEFEEVMRKASSVDSGEVTFAIHSLLEIPDQYNTVRQLGLIRGSKSVSKAK